MTVSLFVYLSVAVSKPDTSFLGHANGFTTSGADIGARSSRGHRKVCTQDYVKGAIGKGAIGTGDYTAGADVVHERVELGRVARQSIEHEGGFARRDADHIGVERPVPATASPQRKDAVEHPGARRWIPRRFRWCRNSSKLVCRPLERQNSSVLAGQRLTDSPPQCAKELLRP